jgi:hypothetical protein
MDQISIQTANPTCRLFLKIDQYKYLAAGVYLSEAPDPPPPDTHCMSTFTAVLIHTVKGEGGGGVGEPVRRLQGHKFTKPVENTNMTDCVSSL